MAEKENCKLFSEFAPNTMQEWIDKVTPDFVTQKMFIL